MTSPTGTTTTTGRTKLYVVIGVLLATALAAAVWFLTRDAPASVDIDDAAGAVAGSEADDATAADATPTTGSGDIDGTWTVDTTIGEFSVTDTTGTFVGFRINEELNNVGATEAIGRTPAVTGELTIEDQTLTSATLTADLTQVVSDRSQRDDNIQDALETAAHPDATFELTDPVDVSGLADGEVVEVDAIGTLTVHGVAQQVTVPLQATIQDGVAVVTGSLEVALSDFGVQAPTAPMVVSVADTATVELQLYLTQS